MRWIGVLLLSLFFLFSPLSVLSAQQSDLSVREQMQNELLILRTQLAGCQQTINSLKTSIAELNKIIADYKTITEDLRKRLDDLNLALQEQQTLYDQLSKQADDLNALVNGLQTENTLLWVGVGVTTAGAIAATIWALSR